MGERAGVARVCCVGDGGSRDGNVLSSRNDVICVTITDFLYHSRAVRLTDLLLDRISRDECVSSSDPVVAYLAAWRVASLSVSTSYSSERACFAIDTESS